MYASRLQSFHELPTLQQRIEHVLDRLPADVLKDLLEDPKFTISLDNFQPGKGSTVFMAPPGPFGDSSRNVVLKPLLAKCSDEFAYYVIAHELAHAFLRNGPWGEITDVEDAADGLASSWGFDRPAETPWGRWRI